MLKSDFFYNLPTELIAQTPLQKRDDSRLLKISRETGEMMHTYFYNLCDFLKKGDLLILNNSKVFPARLKGKKRGGSDVEFLLLSQKGNDFWETMVRPGRRLKKGAVVDFSEKLNAEIIDVLPGGNRLVKFHFDGNFFEILEEIGETPLPPYIIDKTAKSERYNTIYADKEGSAAAPTAGLHFTEGLFSKISEKGVDVAFVTLHVGLGTFRPVKAENILDHTMHAESYFLSEETARKVNACKEKNGRVIAVGTTSCRTLEAAAQNKKVIPGGGGTSIFIYPGYDFKIIDGLITNFHLPESTLIMLVSAFLGREKTLAAYEEAIRHRYRFFSFGDGMFIE